ncbi:deoxynucleoside triphosphate triphosphohydrolase SAMHD1-like [Astyanax mexicanus]|uniref:deoxynucleoside triphosphate triphosphohydrolase SAMHD1-like n=1 Tax=Astyanax mexicanus TaxID=7994 RepID=UPI0020CAA4B8|nr:deoxynucleoside triphosphate triphosphohydrolase SAMHD1-like [Astyanax mexicanus]
MDRAERWEEKLQAWVEHVRNKAGGHQLEFNAQDFKIMPIKINCGMNEDDPISFLRFYRRDEPNIPIQLSRDEISFLLPERFAEIKVMVFYKREDEHVVDLMKRHIEALWEELQRAPENQSEVPLLN